MAPRAVGGGGRALPTHDARDGNADAALDCQEGHKPRRSIANPGAVVLENATPRVEAPRPPENLTDLDGRVGLRRGGRDALLVEGEVRLREHAEIGEASKTSERAAAKSYALRRSSSAKRSPHRSLPRRGGARGERSRTSAMTMAARKGMVAPAWAQATERQPRSCVLYDRTISRAAR